MNFAAAANSTIGRKILMALTGLLMVGFTIGHLTGNLLLLVGPKTFNEYALFLEGLAHGWAVLIADVVLLAVLLGHVFVAISIQMRKKEARPEAYQMVGDAGGASKKTNASMTMIWSGLVLLAFIALHIKNFKYGTTEMIPIGHGEEMRNLYGLVVDFFGDPVFTLVYIAAMVTFGAHLSHGVWSALQSLGLSNATYLPIIRQVGYLLAFLLAFGFLALPAIIFLNNGYFQHLDDTYMQQVTYLLNIGGA